MVIVFSGDAVSALSGRSVRMARMSAFTAGANSPVSVSTRMGLKSESSGGA